MKSKLILLLVLMTALLSTLPLFAQTVVTVGTEGTTNQQRQPFGFYFGYERDATLLTGAELGVNGSVQSLAWYVASPQTTQGPVKIYLKSTTDNALTAMTWDTMVSGAILVYDSQLSFPTAGWQTINLASPFNFAGGNLIVLTETTYGGTGISAYPKFAYTATPTGTNYHEYWYQDNTPPTGNGTLNLNRPTIRLSILSGGPAAFGLSPQAYDFGQLEINTTSLPVSYAMFNTGSGTFNIQSVTLGGDNANQFILTDTNTYPTEVGNGVMKNFTLKFAPNSAGVKTATITVVDALTRLSHTYTVTGNCIDNTVTTFPYQQNFDSVTTPNLPIGWNKLVTSTSSYAAVVTGTSTTSAHSTPNYVSLYNSGDTASTVLLISPQTIIPVNTTRVRFWAVGAVGYNLEVGIMSNPADAATFTSVQTIALTATYAEYIVHFSGSTAQGNYIAFKHGNGSTYRTMYLDDITWELIPSGAQISLLNSSITYTGEVYAQAASLSSFSFTNTGLTNLNVSMATSTPQLALNPTGPVTLTPGQTQVVNVSLTATTAGNFSGTITLTTNDPNTPTAQIAVTATVLAALPQGLVQIGGGTETGLFLPIDPYFGYSYSQMIYKQAEVNYPNGMIQSVAFKATSVLGYTEDEVVLYLAHTTRNEFTSNTDWIAVTDLTEVYRGPLVVPAGQDWVTITLTTPFVYNNTDNLVVAMEQNTTGYHANTDEFYCSSVTGNRSIEYHSDSVNPDPTAPPTASEAPRAKLANVRFQFLQSGNTPVFFAYPTNINFGEQQVGTVSAATTLTIRNNGGGSLILNSPITITGTDASSFVLSDTNTYPISLSIGQGATFSIAFHPTSAGTKNAQVNLTDNTTRIARSIPITGVSIDSSINSFPYVQSFESATFPPIAWAAVNSAADASGWRRNTTADYQYSGTACAQVGYGSGNHYLITPPITVTSQATTLSFWARDHSDATSWDYPAEYLKVLVSTTDTDTTSFSNEILQLGYQDTNLTYAQFFADLTPYVGQTVYLAFLRHSTGGNYVYLDSLSIGNGSAPTFNPPTNLTATAGNAYVDLAWDAPAAINGPVNEYRRVIVSEMVANRSFAGYKVFRNNTVITPTPITTNTYHDTDVVNGTEYSYYVTAVYSSPTGESAPSNTAVATPSSVVLVAPTNLAAQVLVNVNASLTWSIATASTGTTRVGIKVYRNNSVIQTLTDPNASSYTDTNLANGDYTYKVTAVYSEGESAASNTISVNINAPEPNVLFTDSFENYADFAVTLAPWTMSDQDGSATYGLQGVTFPGMTTSMAFMAFNPSATTPAATTIIPHSGNKVLACFDATSGTNNDWLMSPRMTLGTNSSLVFWARSQTDQYGLERIKVGISTAAVPAPANYTFISGDTFIEVPTTWTMYSYDLNAYNNHAISFAIQSVSNNAYVLFVDDVKVISTDGTGNDDPIEPAVTVLNGNFPNPFNPVTNIKFSLKEAAPVSIDIYNVAGQKVKTLVNGKAKAGANQVTWNGTDNNGKKVASGVYFYRMSSGKYSSTKKMVLMK